MSIVLIILALMLCVICIHVLVKHEVEKTVVSFIFLLTFIAISYIVWNGYFEDNPIEKVPTIEDVNNGKAHLMSHYIIEENDTIIKYTIKWNN